MFSTTLEQYGGRSLQRHLEIKGPGRHRIIEVVDRVAELGRVFLVQQVLAADRGGYPAEGPRQAGVKNDVSAEGLGVHGDDRVLAPIFVVVFPGRCEGSFKV